MIICDGTNFLGYILATGKVAYKRRRVSLVKGVTPDVKTRDLIWHGEVVC